MQRMITMKRLFLLALLTFALPAGASARDTICVGLLTGTFENVVVPPGASCTISSSIVNGNVKALRDSLLNINMTLVRGNVHGEKADVVQVRNSTVGGNIHIKEAGHPIIVGAFISQVEVTRGNIDIQKMGDNGQYIVTQTTVRKGHLHVKDNQVDFASEISSSFIGGNVDVHKNVSDNGAAQTVTPNTVGKHLHCKDNSLPFVGGPNTAEKTKGQCF